MNSDQFFQQLWEAYLEITPQAASIHRLFTEGYGQVINDHVAFRTFDLAPIDIDRLEPLILGLGYTRGDEYRFPEKRLQARSYLPREAEQPRVFLSQLMSGELSSDAQAILHGLCRQVDTNACGSPNIFLRGRLWQPPTWAQYRRLQAESEYAAWLSMLGLRANHFTISVNQLPGQPGLQEVNALIKQAGFTLNTSGGEIKGSSQLLLEQSSTLADRVEMVFADGDQHRIASCYYEFAKRYPDDRGNLFQGFVTASADKIFESTD